MVIENDERGWYNFEKNVWRPLIVDIRYYDSSIVPRERLSSISQLFETVVGTMMMLNKKREITPLVIFGYSYRCTVANKSLQRSHFSIVW
jgi:hypothetical protein